ncbi:hypothetical protein Dimus_019371 [Dionaea muscipula]
MTRMTASGCEAVCMLSSFATFCNLSASDHFPARFKSPAKSPPLTVRFAAERVRALTPLTDSGHEKKGICKSYGRRGLLLLFTTLPFLLPTRGYEKHFDAAAKESAIVEYQFIKEELNKVLSKGNAAGVLRLVFHDAGTFESNNSSGTVMGKGFFLCGMNGSILYELDRPENQGLKKSLKLLEKAKSVVDARQSVSWADIISIGGAEAVSLCGGPNIRIRLGRLDSVVPDPKGRLPEESLDAYGLKQCFERKGFSTQELVALSGAHTLGSKGFGNPTVFDNSYYRILLEKPWLSSGDSPDLFHSFFKNLSVLDDIQWNNEKRVE